MSPASVMGVDPSFRRTGWALLTATPQASLKLESWGVIEPKGQGRAEELISIADQFSHVLRLHNPLVACFELPGLWMNGRISRRSVETMAQARGALLMACGREGVSVAEVEFHRVRSVLLGDHMAGKGQVLDLVRALNLLPKAQGRDLEDSDVVDAVMMGLFYLTETQCASLRLFP